MLIRQNAPVLGASASPYLQPGELQISAAFRHLRSDEHYRQTHHEEQREIAGTNVVNMQRLFDIGVSWQATRRLNLSASVPFINSSWALPAPFNPPGPRVPQNGRGLGDITAVGRYWLLDTERHTRTNVSVGIGVKLPTGADDRQDEYPNINGSGTALKFIDQSVQPGDGGWGVIFDGQYFVRVKQALVFASGTYLANPRNTNDTPSIIVGLGVPASPANQSRRVNSVPDQYLVRTGIAVPTGLTGLSASAAFRMEGLKRYDLFGRSDGFRRPGYELFFEPGISYSSGAHTVSFNVPIGFHRNRLPDPYSGGLGDATFPDYIALGHYSFRFGKPRGTSTLPPPTGPVSR